MEEIQNTSSACMQDSLMMKTHDRRDETKSRNDIMARRMKNRERQRRYRARKRLEEDMKKSSVINQSAIPAPQVELQLDGSLSNRISRVYCKRDWKKDARRAFAFKGEEDAPNGSVRPALSISTEIQTLCSPSGNKAEVTLERESHSSFNCESNKPKLGRRDWKADARNKKS